jgi:RimJ/RimL family protein N-acetyltransferase
MDALTFRNATIDDAEVLFNWRNDSLTRQASHDSAELEFKSHVLWLERTLANADRQLFIIEESGKPVGTVRVDREGNESAELSWTVAPEARGRGVAKQMVRLIADYVPETCVLRAEVKAGNTSSIKVAEAVGLHLSKEVDGVLHYYR